MAASSTVPVLQAEGVWKIFGAHAERVWKDCAHPTEKDFRDQGCVVGVGDANFAVYSGEIFVLMGLSGSGKSTLLRCLTGLSPITRGNINITGTHLNSASAAELVRLRREKISMVFQNFALLPHLNALDNTAFPLRIQKMGKPERRAAAESALQLVGLEGKGDRYPHELSGGQQQRVGIARSLVTDPQVWFLDEPFSALDPLIRREMQNEFMRLQLQLRKTIVFVTHDFDEAVRLADRIAIMADGRILQVGSPEDLVLRPASDYVRKFVAGIPKDQVVKSGSIAVPLDGRPLEEQFVLDDKVLAEVAQQIILSEHPLAVRNSEGATVGQISRKELAPWLL